MTTIALRKDLIYPELSYKIVGCAYEVYNELGGGHNENVYQKALDLSFTSRELIHKQQVYYPLTFKGIVIKRNFFDFLIEEKVIVEIKSLGRFTKGHYDQVLNYLNTSGLKLALLITFGPSEVRVKRVINFSKID